MFAMLALLPSWLDPKYILDHYGNSYGGWIVLAIIFAECGLFIGFLLPGDSLLFLAGFFSAKGNMWAWYVLLPALFVAAFAGDQLGYYFGSKIGPPLFDRPDARVFKQKYVRAAHEYLEERGAIAIPLARFVPVVRTFMPIVVGVSDIRYRRYAALDALGALIWAIGVTSIGLILGATLDKAIDIDKYIYPVVAVVVVLSLIPVALEYRASRRREAARMEA
jgi:membrane-associated protein